MMWYMIGVGLLILFVCLLIPFGVYLVFAKVQVGNTFRRIDREKMQEAQKMQDE